MKTSLLYLSVALSTVLVASASAQPKLPLDPEAVVAEMFTDYDVDENNLLNESELVAAFTGMRAKHMAARQGDRPRMGRKGDWADRPNLGTGPGPRSGKGRGPAAGRGPIAPSELVPDLLERFDGNGDKALDTGELLQAIAYQREQRFARRGARPTPTPEATK